MRARRPRLNIHQGRNWLFHAAFFFMLGIALVVFFSTDWSRSPRWIGAACFILLIAFRILDPGPRARTLHALIRSRFRLCPHCRYDLSASPRAGPCPECGHDYHIQDIRRYWRTDRGYSRSTRATRRTDQPEPRA